MKKEFEWLASEAESVADHIFNHRLRNAEREFREIITQVAGLDIQHLPKKIAISLHGTIFTSLKYMSGQEIPKHVHAMDDENNPKHIIHYFIKSEFPDQSILLLLLPEILSDGSKSLSIGIAKRDGKQFFTGWFDSHHELSARRYKGFRDYVALVQYNPVPDLDTYELLEEDRNFSAAYLFSQEATIKLKFPNARLSFA